MDARCVYERSLAEGKRHNFPAALPAHLAERAEEAPKSSYKLYKPGRMKGKREIVARANYVMFYRVTGDLVEVLRVLHAAQQWPRPSAPKRALPCESGAS